jgi:predicted HTH domain antitoxin
MNNVTGSVKQAIITYPNGFPQILKMSDREFVDELRFLAAAKLYELGRLSSGKAAQLAEMERVVFIQRLAQIGVAAINLRDEEIESEIEAGRELGK